MLFTSRLLSRNKWQPRVQRAMKGGLVQEKKMKHFQIIRTPCVLHKSSFKREQTAAKSAKGYEGRVGTGEKNETLSNYK